MLRYFTPTDTCIILVYRPTEIKKSLYIYAQYVDSSGIIASTYIHISIFDTGAYYS